MIQSTSVSTASRFDPRAEEYSERNEVVYQDAYRPLRWAAVIAGAFTAMTLQMVFAVLGVAIGMTIIGTSENASEEGLGIGAGIYWLITGLISLFAGGWMAGRLRNTHDGHASMMHGFITWCVVTVLSATLIAMAGSAALGGSLAVVGDSLFARDAESNVQPASVPNGNNGLNATQHQLTSADTKETAKQTAGGAWWAFIGLLLGATAASVGGMAGARKESVATASPNIKRSNLS